MVGAAGALALTSSRGHKKTLSGRQDSKRLDQSEAGPITVDRTNHPSDANSSHDDGHLAIAAAIGASSVSRSRTKYTLRTDENILTA